MKKIILLLLLISSGIVSAQSSYKDLPGRWRLGFNMGGIWESSDVKPIPGLGGGFTIEKILNKRSDAFLGFSLGLRYLGGRTFGANISPTFDLANNKALNGTFNPAVKYDSVPGFFYANHKTYIQEGALELKMNFPSLEKRTGIIFHLWGGIGIGKYKTWIDALDKDGKMYDFSSIRGTSVSQSDLSRVLDKNYETLAQGSGTNGTWAVIPSLGVGLGYRLGKHTSLVFEHKISFPGTNWLDGIEYPKNCPVTGSKDFYNYTSVGLVFTFYGQHHTSSGGTSSNNHVYTTPTQTVAANNNTYTPPPVIPPPTVVITYPANNYNSPYDYTTVNATLQNVSSSQHITISQNGYSINHFTYNAYNGTLHFQTFLGLGANNFVIVASNQGGTASQGLTINYTPVPTFTATSNNNISNTNTVTVNANSTVTTHTPVGTNTVTPSFTTSTTNTVTSTTTTVTPTFTTSTTNTVTSTGTVTPTFTTSVNGTVSPTHTVAPTFTTSTTSTVTSTSTVSPTFTMSSTGTVTSTSTVSPTPTFTTSSTGTVTSTVHGTATTDAVKPIVTFIDPSAYSTETVADNYNVSATVFNVTTAGRINVKLNGNNLSGFTYNAGTKTVNFSAALMFGYNTITVTGTNSVGSDSKSVIINHKPSGRPPKVAISNPSSSPFTTLQSNIIVSGYVYNVASSANISVTANGAPTTFNYNIGTHEISVPLYLTVPTTQVVITATNTIGSDAQGIELQLKKVTVVTGDTTNTVLHHGGNDANTGGNNNTGGGSTNSGASGLGGVHGLHALPEISVLSPAVDPFYTNTGVISVSANVNYVLMANKVTVSYNGIDVSCTYDINSKHLNFSSPLKPGLNTFVITATNQNGTVNKPVNVNYTPIVVNPSGGNSAPSGNPTYNHGGWNMGGILNNNGGNTTSPVIPRGNTGNQNATPKNTDTAPVNPTVTPTPNVPRTIKGGEVKPGGATEVKPGGGIEQIKRPR